MRLFRTDRRGVPIPCFQRKRPARRHPHLPKIFYLVKNQHWPQALQRARSHSHEICVQEDISGDTALHIACRLNPPANLIQAMREACSIANSEGAIPIHVAATHRCSPEAIQMLLEQGEGKDFYPAAALTRMGRAPIHYACFSHRGLSLPAFQILLEATLKTGSYQKLATSVDYDLEDLMEDDEYSQFGEDDNYEEESNIDTNKIIDNVVTLRDATGQTPLGLLFRRYRERVRIVIREMDQSHPLAAALRVQRDLGELWDKARWIVARLTQEQVKPCNTLLTTTILGNYEEVPESPAEQAIAQEAAKWAYERFSRTPCGTASSSEITETSSKRAFRIVHASVGLTGFGCPTEMIRLALSIHPDQVREMDEDGNLPIHICAMAPSLVFNRNDDDSSFLSEFSLFSTATSSSRPPTNAFEKVFKILLQHYPAAVRVPHGITGKLPLTLAFDGRTWEDGIRTLLDAYPAALESKKLPTMGLYPFVIARIGNSLSPLDRKQSKGRTAIFELLRAKPDLVKLG